MRRQRIPILTALALAFIAICIVVIGAWDIFTSWGGWVVTFMRDELDGEKRLLEKEVDPQTLIYEVVSAANTVVSLCRRNGWESSDLTTLENELAEVSKLAQTYSRP